MKNVLVILVGEQAAPNVLVILEPAFADVAEYWLVTTTKMEHQGRTNHLLTATGIDPEKVVVIVVPPDDPSVVGERLSEVHSENNRYVVSLTGSTKMIGAGAWSFFIKNRLNAKILYVLSGANTYRIVHPASAVGDYPLEYRFSVKSYLQAYGIAYEVPVYGYQQNLDTELQLFTDFLSGEKPLPKRSESTLELSYAIGKQLQRMKSKQFVSYDQDGWISSWLAYVHFIPERKLFIKREELKYLQSLWFEHYLSNTIIRELALSPTECVHGWKLYPAVDGKKLAGRNHEFDVLFCHENKLYVIEAKIGFGKANRSTLKLKFNNALFRLAALRKDYGFHVQTILVTLSSKLRKSNHQPLQNHFAREASLLNVKVVDRPLLEAGPKVWLPHILAK